MEHIQFLNYILSIAAVLLAGAAFWIVWSTEEKREHDLQDLRERINTVARSADNNKKK